MNKLYLKLYNSFLNFNLQKKIISITIFVAFLTLTASLLSFSVVQKANSRLLYKSLAGSLNSSAENISDTLKNLEALSKTITSNKSIRSGLISLVDEAYSPIHVKNVTNTINQQLTEAHKSIAEINYITLKNPYTVSTSYEPASSRINYEITNSVIEKSEKNAGYPSWVTDYCNTDGLFLVRNCIRIQTLNQENLGTLIINVNMDKLIQNSTDSILYNENVRYIVYQDNQLLYHTKNLSNDETLFLQKKLDADYKIIRLKHSDFFCVKGQIKSTGWNYICLVPYTEISQQLTLAVFTAFLFILFSVFLSLYLASKYVKRITEDFNVLMDKMKSFGSGNYNEENVNFDYSTRKDEIAILHHHFDDMTIQINNLIRENYLNELLKKDAQLRSLQSQVNPHFLYNALDSINWRAKAIGANIISSMIEALGILLRASMSQQKNLISIKEDLDVVHSYITIQKIRFDEERLCYKESLPEDIFIASIPKMSIQPLVDNAINYAMEYIIDQCIIEVSGYIKNDIIHILITNNGSQFEDDLLDKLRNGTVKAHGIGIGLLNIDQRIKLIFGNDFGLSLYNPDDDHATAELIFPRRTEC